MSPCNKGKHFGVWSDENNISRLKEWWAEGYSCLRIVDEFAAIGITITKNSVIGKVHRLGVLRKDEARHKVRTPVRKIKRKPEKIIDFRLKRNGKPATGGPVMASNPDPNKRVLLRQVRDGQCKAIIGYLNGVLADAVCCGEDAPMIIRRGRVAHASWCPHHHEIYTQKSKHESSR